MYPITITKIDNGVLVKVGCKTLAYQNNQYKMLVDDIRGYLEARDKTQKAVFKRWGIKESEGTPITGRTHGWITYDDAEAGADPRITVGSSA